MINYLAYGSNLHPVRLTERVPSAELVGSVVVCEHALMFHKKGMDDSGKCSLYKTGQKSDLVYGALFQLNPEHKEDLDRFEGKGHGYIETQISVEHENVRYDCFTYIAQQSHIVDGLQPYHWYKELVVQGAGYLNFPDEYILSIREVESVEDPDFIRRREHQQLLERVKNYR